MKKKALYFVAMLYVDKIFATQPGYVRYAQKQGISARDYQPTPHKAGVLSLLQYKVKIGSRRYKDNINAVDFFNEHFEKLKPLVAYKSSLKLVVGFTWIHKDIRKSRINPNIYVHHNYSKKFISQLLLAKARLSLYSRKPQRPTPPSLNLIKKMIIGCAPYCAALLTYYGLLSLQTMYYQQQYSAQEFKKLCFSVSCGFALYKIYNKIKPFYVSRPYPYQN